MKSLTKEQQKSYENAKICYTSNKKLEDKKIKNIVRLGTIVIIQGNIEVLHISYII